ncbi:hypothetical protein [Streptomyces cadmiisoli]|uniref:hypothetical protein n=1 Tax=Streptomyces cadmiisoli TaxID=2184053 RepID=UPI003D75768D
MRRLEKGAPLRDAMRAAGLDIPRLAAATKSVDPSGEGLSRASVGHIVGAGKTAREECSDRAAELITSALAKALGQEVDGLFEVPVFTPERSTSTRRSQIPEPRAPQLPEQLMTQPELATFLRKSLSWIDSQISEARQQGETWPGLIYVGRSRRFDPHAVLAGMRRQHTHA